MSLTRKLVPDFGVFQQLDGNGLIVPPTTHAVVLVTAGHGTEAVWLDALVASAAQAARTRVLVVECCASSDHYDARALQRLGVSAATVVRVPLASLLVKSIDAASDVYERAWQVLRAQGDALRGGAVVLRGCDFLIPLAAAASGTPDPGRLLWFVRKVAGLAATVYVHMRAPAHEAEAGYAAAARCAAAGVAHVAQAVVSARALETGHAADVSGTVTVGRGGAGGFNVDVGTYQYLVTHDGVKIFYT